MNLTALLRRDAAIEDHSLVDHSWMQESGLARVDDPILDIDSMRNPNNVKPQLEMEWGVGGPDIDLDEPAGAVQRNVSDDIGDPEPVIMFARDMMNRGYRGSQVVASLRKRFPSALLANASKGLRSMFALEGLVGRIMVDARGYRSCQDALKSASNSPFKRFVKYTFGCCCGEPHVLPSNDMDIIGSVQESAGNPTDAFLAGEKTTSKTATHCRSTMLPILSSQGDIDKSLLDGTLIEMMNLTPVPEGVLKDIRAMKTSNLAKIRAAFRWLDNSIDASEGSKYANDADSGAFNLVHADNEIDIFDAPLADIPVDERPASLDVDVELFESPDMGIEMEQFKEPEFEGTGDEIVVDDFEQAPPQLDVSMTQDMEV